MNIIPLPSKNYFEPAEMSDSTIAALCMHGTASDGLQSALDWLRNPQPRNPKAAVSANYVISKAGVIYELVDPFSGKRAWANGWVESFDNSVQWLADAVKHKVNPNWKTISFEHEATWADMVNRGHMTDNQWAASQELAAYCLRRCGLKANHETIITHSQISGRQKYNCPGVIFTPSYTEQLIKANPDLA